jgi:hypothetical protein
LFVFSVVLDCLVLHDPNYPGLLFFSQWPGLVAQHEQHQSTAALALGQGRGWLIFMGRFTT